jgi:hypothetical protein
MSDSRKYNSKGRLIEELDIRDLFMSPKPVSQGKRKFCNAFESETFDDDRYGQHISSDFFKTNISLDYQERKTFTSLQEKEILQWCENYLANKKSNNVVL